MLLALTGCSPTIQTGGHQVADPEQPLAAALTKLKQDNSAGIQNNSITVSDNTNCFYLLPNADAKDISAEVACGPIRRLAQPQSKVWDTYALTFGRPTDGKVSATVGAVKATAIALDTKLLRSPNGTKPSPASALPAPTAPQTSVTDRAIALPAGSLTGLTFTAPAQQATLITPTARFRITGVAQPKTVPVQLVAGTDDPAGQAAYYRPAAGQRLLAMTVAVSDPVEKSTLVGTAATSAKPASLSTELGIDIGGKTIPIIDATAAGSQPASARAPLTVACQPGAQQSYPCRPTNTDFVVLMSVPIGGSVSLAATSDGHRQTVDPAAGTLSSGVSQLEYARTHLTTTVDKTLKVAPYTARVSVTKQIPAASTSPDPKSSSSPNPKATSPTPTSKPVTTKTVTAVRKASWSMEVGSAQLSAFDPTRGWAPAGKAWLTVQTSAYRKADPSGAFTDHRVGSVVLTAGGASYHPDGLTDADFTGPTPAATDTVAWVFQVPAELTSADLDFQPTGLVSADGTTASFTVAQPAVAAITFGK